ncbi:MAG: riboflavin synthase [Proteobacteria bacterium]|nr:riboflavin synthase [Pseudomonadota bacterium]
MSGRWEFSIKTTVMPNDIREGDSISIDGVCLTVKRVAKNMFYVDASLETLNLTTFKEKKTGDRVNIERAMKSDGRFGGHIVMGHVDGIGTIVEMKQSGDSVRLEIQVPADISKYIVKKGSIAIDGISLTVNEQSDNKFTVNIIPYTLSKTTLGEKNLRDKVNIETDVIGKYVENFITKGKNKGIDLDFLYKHGFIKGE